jgi:hypothetical protein
MAVRSRQSAHAARRTAEPQTRSCATRPSTPSVCRSPARCWPLAGAAPAQVVLKAGHFDKDRSRFGTGAIVLCDDLARRMRGRCRCERQGDALGTAPDLPAALREGQLDMVNLPIDPLETMLPELGLFNIPFLFRDEAHARRTLDGLIGRGLLGMLQDKGPVGLAWTEFGRRHMRNSLRPIVKAANVRWFARHPAAAVGPSGPADRAEFDALADALRRAGQRSTIMRDNVVGLSVRKRNGVAIVKRVDGESVRGAMAPAYAGYARTFGADTIVAVQAVK